MPGWKLRNRPTAAKELQTLTSTLLFCADNALTRSRETKGVNNKTKSSYFTKD